MDTVVDSQDRSGGLGEPGSLENLPGVIAALGELKPGAVVTEEGVSHLFGRHAASVKRAVQRGELPHPCRLFGQNAWTVGAIVSHIEARLQEAADEAELVSRRIARHTT